jgi:Zn/Cd-binding protein ZinT
MFPYDYDKKTLYDYDKGRRGVFVYKHSVKPRDLPDGIEEGYKIEYIPNRDLLRSPMRAAKLWTSLSNRVDKISTVTEDIYSDKAVHHVELDWHQDHDGVPQKGVVLLQNVKEEAKLRQRVENETEAKLQMMEEELRNERLQNAIQKAENRGKEGSKRAASDKEEPKRRNRRRKDSKNHRRKDSRRGRGRDSDD